MDLPDIGSRCEAYLCGDRDFLPIQCPSCKKTFCRHHSSLDAHSCPLPSNADSKNLVQSGYPKRAKCAFGNCQKATLESNIVDITQSDHRVVAVCPNCAQAFCAVHRHPTDHTCSGVPPNLTSSLSQRNPEAHELLAKNFPPRSLASGSDVVSSSAAHPSKPINAMNSKKAARLRAVEVMKMRHQAIPADRRDKSASTAPSERLHVKIRVNSDTSVADKVFWLRKNVGTGRALDMIAEQLSIRISDTDPASLKKVSPVTGGETVLRNDELISKQVDDGELLILTTKKAV